MTVIVAVFFDAAHGQCAVEYLRRRLQMGGGVVAHKCENARANMARADKHYCREPHRFAAMSSSSMIHSGIR